VSAIFILAPPAQSSGPLASWLTAAQWAGAARRFHGEARIVTPEGVFSPEGALARGSTPLLKSRQASRLRRAVPGIVETASKDARRWAAARSLRKTTLNGTLDSIGATENVSIVWQYHYLFANVGADVARKLGVPLVQWVEAPQVWEAGRWGVERPLWGRLLEQVAEKPQLQAADLVACVSEEVAGVIKSRFGVSRVVVAPNGVDAERFSPSVSGLEVRERYGLDGKFVIGWAGSFRPYHSLELALRSAATLRSTIPNLALLLVGDGQTRASVADLARSLQLEAAFTGTVTFDEMPAHVAAMDVAVLPHGDRSGFHYSPLKLLEYMAAGKPVVAAGVGQVETLLEDGRNGYLVASGDEAGLARAIERIHGDPNHAMELGRGARRTVLDGWSWDRQYERVIAALRH
jgi:glycosyltransferase involved in cell wall biosynthesis